MTFKQAVITCLKEKYFSIEGRASRSQYWYFWLLYVLVTIALAPVDALLFSLGGFGPLSALFNLAMFIPFITVAVRRLHDRDLSGWWMLLMLVPVIGSIALLILYVLPGTDGPNQFGPDPLDNGGIAAWSGDDENLSPTSIPRVDRE